MRRGILHHATWNAARLEVRKEARTQRTARMGDMKAIIVEDVDGLADCINAAALALVWEDRIVIDTELRKKPNLRRNALRHEWRHIMNVRKRGMTKKAGRVNALIEHEYQWALWVMVGGLVVAVHFQNVPIFFFALVLQWLVNRWYWHWRVRPLSS